MKIAVAGKGGVGKTSLSAWLGDYLSRQGKDVWMVDADTALSLGAALGVADEDIPTPLIADEALVRERVGGGGMIDLNPKVDDLPARLAVPAGDMHLLVMGAVAGAGGGCACAANSLLKALLAHLVMDRDQWLIVDLEAGVEHLGRGTVAAVDALVVVSEPSARSLGTAASVGRMAFDLGLSRRALMLNRTPGSPKLLDLDGLPPLAGVIPPLAGLVERQLHNASVLGLPERDELDKICHALLSVITPE